MDPKNIILLLLETADQIEVFHWQTKSYAEHKALGAFYDALSDASDSITEALLGHGGERPSLKSSFEIQDHKEGAPIKYIRAFANEISGWTDLPKDVLNMRDDLLAEANTTIYLLSLK